MAADTVSLLMFSIGLAPLAAAAVFFFLFRKLLPTSTSSTNPAAGLKKHHHQQMLKSGRSSGNSYTWPSRYRGLNLPPGPRGWPLVGNLFQVARSGKPFIHYVTDLHRAYGPIFTLRMGTRTLIMLCDAGLAHEALIKGGELFASRPAENPTRNIFSCDKFTVNSAVYGAEWRSLRRNMVSGMLSQARLREFRPVREAAMDRLVERIRVEAESSEDGIVWVLSNARFAVFCILLSMCFGLDLDEKTVVSVERAMKKVLLVLNPRIDDYLPILSPFFAKQRKETLRVRKEQIQTLAPLIEKRRQLLKNNMQGDAMPFSYLDSLLDLKVEGREDRSPPSDEELVTLCSEFLNGGTDTTATAIEWSVARLIENPDMQKKLYEEIVAATTTTPSTGTQKTVDIKDVEGMPYLQAFVKEILRLHPPTYFTFTHAAMKPGAKLGGYDIPAEANLEIYLPLISKDPNIWDDPDHFRPERFLVGDGSVKEEIVDMTGVKGVRMIPFGAGRRICPGLAMGTTHVALMVARMIQAFEWKAHPSQPTIDLSDKLEFTVVMNTPLRALVSPRS